MLRHQPPCHAFLQPSPCPVAGMKNGGGFAIFWRTRIHNNFPTLPALARGGITR